MTASRTLAVDAPDAEVVHRAIHHLHDLGRRLHAGGGGVPGQRGTVARLSTSDGGVPKMPIATGDEVVVEH